MRLLLMLSSDQSPLCKTETCWSWAKQFCGIAL